MLNSNHCSYRVIFVCYHYIGQSAVVTKPISLIPDEVEDNPNDILRIHFYGLVAAISTNLNRVTDALYAKSLISQGTTEEIQAKTELNDYIKSTHLVSTTVKILVASLTPDQYLTDICHVLLKQEDPTLTDIVTNILHQLGEYNMCTLMSSTV